MSDPPDSVVRKLRRRRQARVGTVIFLVLLALSALLDHLGAFGYRGDDWKNFDKQTVSVVRVADGDTITVRSNDGRETRVRLIGVDAPELHHDDGSPADHWADRAAGYVRGRLEGKSIILLVGPTETRDRYGRLLAYVYLNDSDNVNLDLVRDGQAYADRRHDHTFRTQFEQAEAEARKKGRGLWQDVREDDMPEWRRRWLERVRARNEAPAGRGAPWPIPHDQSSPTLLDFSLSATQGRLQSPDHEVFLRRIRW
ncbi:MAG: thermonuclease family protein [Tepidisphaeraceae bacterium]